MVNIEVTINYKGTCDVYTLIQGFAQTVLQTFI